MWIIDRYSYLFGKDDGEDNENKIVLMDRCPIDVLAYMYLSGINNKYYEISTWITFFYEENKDNYLSGRSRIQFYFFNFCVNFSKNFFSHKNQYLKISILFGMRFLLLRLIACVLVYLKTISALSSCTSHGLTITRSPALTL